MNDPKRILYVLQQNVYNNKGQFVSTDSCINVVIGIVTELLVKMPDTAFYIAYSGPFMDINSPEELLQHNRVQWINMHHPVNAILLRYHFNSAQWAAVLNVMKPDLIINCITEQTRNFRALLNSLDMHDTKIISCNYFIDAEHIDLEPKVERSVGYMWRQFDGAFTADLVPFSCESTRDVFLDNMEITLDLDEAMKIQNKCTVWDFGFSQAELDRYRLGAAITTQLEKTTIIFPNRLGSTNYTHWKEFIEAINLLWEKRQDFQVLIPNHSGKMSWQWLRENVKGIYIPKEDVFTRKEYIQHLWASDIVVSLFTEERYGGCANREGIYCNCLPVMPRINEYEKLAPQDYPGFVKSVNPQDIAKTLEYLLEHGAREYTIGMRRTVAQRCSYEAVSDAVTQDIRDCYNAK